MVACCCNKNCSKYTIYDINDILNCKSIVNFIAILPDTIDDIKKTGILDFIDEVKFKKISNYICLYWKSNISIIKALFRNRYFITSNVEIVICDIYNLFKNYLLQEIQKLFMYADSLDYTNNSENTERESIYTINDEPERTEISGTDDFMKKNIKYQTATNDKDKKSNKFKSITEALNVDSEFNKINGNFLMIINSYCIPYVKQHYGIVCTEIKDGI